MLVRLPRSQGRAGWGPCRSAWAPADRATRDARRGGACRDGLRVSLVVVLAGRRPAPGAWGLWASLTAARLDLDAARGMRARLRRESDGAPAGRLHPDRDGEPRAAPAIERGVHGARAPRRVPADRRAAGTIHLRPARLTANRAELVRLSVRGPWIVDVTRATDGAGRRRTPRSNPSCSRASARRDSSAAGPLALGEMSPVPPGRRPRGRRTIGSSSIPGLDVVAVGRAARREHRAGRDHAGRQHAHAAAREEPRLGPGADVAPRRSSEARSPWRSSAGYEKEKILEAYLNTVYLGQRGRGGAFVGVGAAAPELLGQGCPPARAGGERAPCRASSARRIATRRTSTRRAPSSAGTQCCAGCTSSG